MLREEIQGIETGVWSPNRNSPPTPIESILHAYKTKTETETESLRLWIPSSEFTSSFKTE